jgi:hypothetical protein
MNLYQKLGLLVMSLGMIVMFFIGHYMRPIPCCKPCEQHPVTDCTLRLELEQNLHGEYYHKWRECDADLKDYVQLSVMATCLNEYDRWHEWIDECEERMRR